MHCTYIQVRENWFYTESLYPIRRLHRPTGHMCFDNFFFSFSHMPLYHKVTTHWPLSVDCKHTYTDAYTHKHTITHTDAGRICVNPQLYAHILQVQRKTTKQGSVCLQLCGKMTAIQGKHRHTHTWAHTHTQAQTLFNFISEIVNHD